MPDRDTRLTRRTLVAAASAGALAAPMIGRAYAQRAWPLVLAKGPEALGARLAKGNPGLENIIQRAGIPVN